MKKFSILILTCAFLFFLPSIGNAQSKKMLKANEYFNSGEYLKAYELYVKIFPKAKQKEEKAEISYKAGVCSKYMLDPKNTIMWLRRAVLYKYQDPLVNLYLAEAYMLRGLYDEAKEYFANYKDLVPSDERGENGLKSCEIAQVWIKNPTRFIVEEVNIINSRDNDFAPSFSGKDTNTIYFTSTRSTTNGNYVNSNSGVNFADIFVSKKDKKGIWTVPVPVPGSINSEYDDGSCTVSNDGRILFYTYCPIIEGKDAGCKIYFSEFSGDQWGAPQLLEISAESTADTAMSLGHPALSHDGLTLYFISDDKRGIGGKDIWMITRRDKNSKWSAPKNLGADINTKYDELYPACDNEGNLYFSTDGRVGMGGLDIYKATTKEGGGWTVENMQSPVNSFANDFGIVFNPYTKGGYLSSNRSSTKGDDIYRFWEKPLSITLKGFVINDINHAYLMDVNVEITGSDGSKNNLKTDDKGAFSVKLKEEVDYIILTDKKTFLKATGSVSTKGVEEDGKVFETELYMKPSGISIKIPNIRYDFGQTTLREESKVALDELIEILELNSNITIELSAHTDFRGSDEANLKLSQGRAQSVVDYLIQNGIKEDRLEAKGYGETEPYVVDVLTARTYPFLEVGDVLSESFIMALQSEEQREVCHELNRRTEFKVLSDTYGENFEKFGEN
ncbi:MAG: OmpA family protein [Bacteroidales bacterium]|nr:OmpA family protein [Bacteroidales bacterium]